MRRRLAAAVLASALVVTALAVPAAAAPPQAGRPSVAPAAEPADPAAEAALAQLEDAAEGEVDVTRDETGSVTAVSSSDGEAVLASDATTPEQAAREQLGEHGEVVGIDGAASRAVVTATIPTAAGGTVVRAEQRVDGVPVFGGEVVLGLDATDDLVTLDAATVRDADEVDLPAPRVSGERAVALAVEATSRARSVAAARLSGVLQGRRVFDPALVGLEDPLGVRPVWEVEVRDGSAVRETVLVGSDRGAVALRFDNAPRADSRWVCDNAAASTQPDEAAVPVCTTPAASEQSPPYLDPFEPDHPDTAHPDVVAAYDHLGATAETFRQLRPQDAPDLTSMLGPDRLVATVRWCAEDRCPYGNAFWDGRQVVLGEGFAQADDVVAHELTHGFVEATAGLFYFQQSGALNESLADTIGEVVDRRQGAEDGEEWLIGEDLEGGPLRSMTDPTQQRQPDHMTSDLWSVENWDEGDHGAVHHNVGVGNRTAYLVAQGIDADDPRLSKTGTLYLDAIPRLTAGAQYADLGRVLLSTCQQLVEAGTAGFDAADCEAVASATAATGLDLPPAEAGSALGEAPRTCPTGVVPTTALMDSDEADDFAWTTSGAGARGAAYSMWQRVTNYARHGAESFHGYNPDPTGFADAEPAVSTATSVPLEVPLSVDGAYFRFDHAFAFDYVRRQSDGVEVYPDGATVRVERRVGADWQQVPLPAAAWTNGPRQQVVGQSGFTGFGGDSKGWGSSRLDLTSLAGTEVRIVLAIEADQRVAHHGWWLDDLELYTCDGTAPTAPRSLATATSGRTATLSWLPPASGAAVTGYRVTRSDGSATTLPAAARTTVLRGFTATGDVDVDVAALTRGGASGAPATTRLEATTTQVVRPLRVRRGQRFVVTGKVVERGTTRGVPQVSLVLQRRFAGAAWRTVARGDSNAAGVRRWTVSQPRGAYYRVVSTAEGRWFGSVSPAPLVRMR